MGKRSLIDKTLFCFVGCVIVILVVSFPIYYIVTKGVFMDDVAHLDIEKIGPYFENHERFPERTNTEFVHIIDKEHVEMRVWERGTGETLACGTGCCATTVACVINGLTKHKVAVKLLGGELLCEWDTEANLVYMTGPAVSVFNGEIEI